MVNTSFKMRGEPIARTPEEPFDCLMGAEIWVLVVGGCLLRKGATESGAETGPFWSVRVKDVPIVEPSGGKTALSPVR
jgi:hypothetical protein